MNNEKPRLWTRNFVLIIVINFLVFMNHIMLLSTFPFYIESLGGSEALAGLAATLFSLVAVLCRPFVGWMLDNGKRRAILLAGLAGMLLMPLGYMFASVIFLAFVFRMVHGASLALSNTATATIASDVIPAPRFAEGMGMFGMATALATSCAPALGLYLMDSFSYTVLFACASGSVVIALILFAILKNTPIKAEKKPLNVSALFSRAAVPASVIALVFMLTFGALENFLAKYAVEAELPSGGLFFAIMAVMLLLVRVVLGKYADKRARRCSSTPATRPCSRPSCCSPSRRTRSRSSSPPCSRATASAGWSLRCNPWPCTAPPRRSAAPRTLLSSAHMTSASGLAAASRAC